MKMKCYITISSPNKNKKNYKTEYKLLWYYTIQSCLHDDCIPTKRTLLNLSVVLCSI